MKHLLKKEILKLKNKLNINQTTINKFQSFVDSEKKLTKSEGNQIHICTFFLPINKKTKSIYLINHIKAQMWIPPGGHIEKEEHPIRTVIREFEEELDHQLITEKVRLFNLSITAIDRPWQNCVTHYDFWYSVEVEKIQFNFLKKEFYQGDWFDFESGIKKITRKSYQNIIKNLIKVL